MNINTKIEFEKGSDNVFADFDLEDADDLFERAQIGFHILNLIDALAITPQALSKLLNISPSNIEELLDGHSSQFSTEQLLDFHRRLENVQVDSEQTQYYMDLAGIQTPLPTTATIDQ